MTFPAEPLTGLAEGAIALHELYTTYIAAGFADWQALWLVGLFLSYALEKGQ